MTSCRERLKSITGCCDVATLKSAEAEKRRALCFLRLESPVQERELMTTLGASRFGEDLLVILDLQPANASSSR